MARSIFPVREGVFLREKAFAADHPIRAYAKRVLPRTGTKRTDDG